MTAAPICTDLGADLALALRPSLFAERRLAGVLPALDQWQVDAVDCQARNILMLCGRQTGKSTTAATIATHVSSQWPEELVLLLSPTQRQSAELFRKTMVLYDALEHAPAIEGRTKTELHLANGSSIVSLPGSNPDSIRGYSKPSLIIEDESAFVLDATFVASRPMLATSKRGRHILMTTPFGRRGHFWDLWSSDDPDWFKIAVLSAMCPRIPAAFLAAERRTLSDRAYRQEYECEFLESAVSVFPADWLERLVDDDERHGATLPDAMPAGLVHAAEPGAWAGLG